MRLDITQVDEHSDGSATYTFDYDAVTLKDMITTSLNDIVTHDRLELGEWISDVAPKTDDLSEEELRVVLSDSVVQYLFTHVIKVGLENWVDREKDSHQLNLNI